ncbi:MAG: ribonuclease P protein subunit [Candidatus Thermoplasmatota archaeon]|nr:ribonuclease P protein subunit [Candidatus Thermoplasmatota archaeon]
MTKKNDQNSLHAFEFIGAQIQVAESDHEGYEDVEGKVVDETKNTLVIGNDEDKVVPKEGNVFEVKIKDDWETLHGSKLTYRPEERIKKLG